MNRSAAIDERCGSAEGKLITNSLRALHYLGSLKLTLALLLLFTFCIATYYFLEQSYNSLIATPLFLLSLNLLSAIIIKPIFRSQISLLLFHLALLGLLILIAASRLSYFKGSAEITNGEAFSGAISSTQGPWHQSRIDKIHFILDDFVINYTSYNKTPQRDDTKAYLRWTDSAGNTNQGVVGDHRPLIMEGYRFYTTHNKGFAPLFVWQPKGGRPQQGSIHLPAYPANEYNQAIDWNIPGTSHHLWTQLQFDETILNPNSASQFHAPGEHLLIVRDGEQRHEIRPGQTLTFNDGLLTYKELRTWMGFLVLSDWTLPWLFAAGFLAALSLGWHYWRKVSDRPWLQEQVITR